MTNAPTVNVDKVKKAMDLQNASNPRPLAGLLHQWLVEDQVTMVGIGNDEAVPLHIRLVLGHLNFLLGKGIGPELSELEEGFKVIEG